jgi:hypothetical protein
VHDNETADSYVPPDPPPVKINDPVTALLLIGVIGAPLVWVIVGILLTFEPTRLGIACVIVFVGCFVALVARSGRAPKQEADGWDDGAVL